MDANAVDRLLRRWRKKPLWSLVESGEDSQWWDCPFQRTELEYLLPHRSPFLLLDRLLRYADAGLEDSPGGLVIAERRLAPEDPVFAGHFPDFPVYPGVLQLEMLGQLALCLVYLQTSGKDRPVLPVLPVPQEPQKLAVRASRVLGAYYLRPVLPGQTVELQACQLGHSDGLFGRMLGQVVAGGKVATVCAQEVCFVDA